MSIKIKDLKFDPKTESNIEHWLKGKYDQETKNQIQHLLETDSRALADAFYTNLSFGTAGMRGIMGVGSNRMNIYTIRLATQGLANYILKQPIPIDGYKVFIGYDSRHHSQEFAQEASKVLAGNGIRALLCQDIRPTPLVSFGCRYKHCIAAIMITASHNPPQYNGYKVYWSDGGQVLPPHDKGIIDEVEALKDQTMIRMVDSLRYPLIEFVGDDVDKAYLKEIDSLQLYPSQNQKDGKNLQVIYTSLHGTGITLMPQALKMWGFPNFVLVQDQCKPNGDFPTAPSPNPEDRKALQLGIELLQKNQADLLIATDPDADRLGVAYLENGAVKLLNGNQIAVLCLDHICEALTVQKKLPAKAAFIKSVVTTELFQAIAESYKSHCCNVLTGFKYIAEKIREWESDPNGYKFIFGAEESYGYLLGTQTRDKDAIVAGVLLCEIALKAKLKNKTLSDLLEHIYRKYGVYAEKVISINFEETRAGKEQMTKGMEKLRQHPPTQLGGIQVEEIDDYQTLIKKNLTRGETKKIELPKADLVVFWLNDGSKLMVRPSGTEPKIKIYGGIKNTNTTSITEAFKQADKQADTLLIELKEILSK